MLQRARLVARARPPVPRVRFPPRAPAWRAALPVRALSASAATPEKKEKKKRKLVPDLSMPAGALYREVYRLAKDQRPLLAAGSAALVVAAGVTMYIPAGFGSIIDIVTGAKEGVTLGGYAAQLAALMAVGAAATFGRVLSFQLAGHRLIARVRRELFGSLVEQDIAFFDRHRTGELINRLSSDTVVMSRSLTGPTLSQGLRSVAQAVAGFGYMVYMSPELTLAMIGIVPVAAGGAFAYGRFVKGLSARVQDALAETTAVAEERLGNVRTVRAFVQEAAERARYAAEVDKVYALASREAVVSAAFFSGAGLAGSATMLSVLLYGGHLVSLGSLTGGTMTSFLMYTVYVGASLISLSSFYGELMKGFGAADRVVSLLLRGRPRPDADAAAAPAALAAPEHLAGEIRFDRVAFRYPTRPDAEVFRGLDLTVAAGTVVAVVGQSGSGKSTLAALLLRFYEPEGGCVRLDGVPVSELDPAWLRRNIGYVSQEPRLFGTTVRENIAYGRPDATDAEVEAAAREANAHAFIEAFPQGYDTPVGEQGATLSGGQRQRIAIARALLKNPRIMVLDEATSALDQESELAVQEALERLMRGRTVIVIAHRLSTVKSADSIAVLVDGEVAEMGPHHELIAHDGGAYQRLMRVGGHGLD